MRRDVLYFKWWHTYIYTHTQKKSTYILEGCILFSSFFFILMIMMLLLSFSLSLSLSLSLCNTVLDLCACCSHDEKWV
jgi:hypothetical protein